MTAAIWNDAEGAAVIAAVLHLDEYPRQAVLVALQEMGGHLRDAHDVGDGDLFTGLDPELCSAFERGASRAPGFRAHLVIVAEHAIDFRHAREHVWLRLRRTTGDHDPQLRPRPLEPPDRLPRLRHRFIGDRATVDDDGFAEPGVLGVAGDHLGFEGVEPATKGDDFHAHVTPHSRYATEANSDGSKRPSYSKLAVPVINTWSSRSRHSMVSSPPGRAICTVRLARFRRAAATAVAHAAEPQAFVNPAPRSQVRIVMWSRSTMCANVMLARSGKIGWFSRSGPKRARSYASTSSTQKIACGFPMLTTEGVCSTGASIGPICSSIERVSRNSSARGISFQPNFGGPISTVYSPSGACQQFNSPALVSNVAAVWPVASNNRRATQRMPLPQAATSDPSLL